MTQSQPQFDFDAVFEVNDHMYFYGDSLTDERSDAEVTGLVQIARLEAPQRILDVPCLAGIPTAWRHSDTI
jgi:hypothetical protein